MLDTKVYTICQPHQNSFKCTPVLQAYIHQMTACLAHLTDRPLTEKSISPAAQRLSELAIECGQLLVITLISNPERFKDLQNYNMDKRIVCPDAQPPSFYCEVMVTCKSVKPMLRVCCAACFASSMCKPHACQHTYSFDCNLLVPLLRCCRKLWNTVY